MLPLGASLAEAVLAVGKQVQPFGSVKADASAMDILFSGYGALLKVFFPPSPSVYYTGNLSTYSPPGPAQHQPRPAADSGLRARGAANEEA